jgi:hypothetical protein
VVKRRSNTQTQTQTRRATVNGEDGDLEYQKRQLCPWAEARDVSDDDHDSQRIIHDHKASTAQQANLSTLYVSLKRLHAHMMLLRRVNACDLTDLGGHDCKVYTSGFMKAVAAAVHELENNACVHLVAAPAQRLQHAQSMIGVVWLFQNQPRALHHGIDTHHHVHSPPARYQSLRLAVNTSAGGRDGAAPGARCTPSQLQLPPHICRVPACVSGLHRGRAGEGQHCCGLKPALSMSSANPETITCGVLRNGPAIQRPMPQDSRLWFQTDDPQDFQSARAAAGKDQAHLRAKLLHQLVDHG